jgi:squalene synthase HpnC
MSQGVTRLGEARAVAAACPSAEAIGAAAADQASGENFPVALRLLPARYRQRLAAVYGFARAVDDMGDEAPPGDRLRLLDELEADLGRLYQFQDVSLRTGAATAPAGTGPGQPRIGVIRALAPAVAECAIPQQPFTDLIQANRQDQVVTRYRTFGELAGYCELSANPVGRIVLYVFGAATPDRIALSDRVCTALQLAEHWQDVAEDFRAGRIYLPAEDMDRFGCQEADLAAGRAGPQLRELLTFEVRRARALLDEGAPLVGNLRGAARVAVAGYVAGGRAALAAIAAAGYDVLQATPRPRRSRIAREALRIYAAGR